MLCHPTTIKPQSLSKLSPRCNMEKYNVQGFVNDCTQDVDQTLASSSDVHQSHFYMNELDQYSSIGITHNITIPLFKYNTNATISDTLQTRYCTFSIDIMSIILWPFTYSDLRTNHSSIIPSKRYYQSVDEPALSLILHTEKVTAISSLTPPSCNFPVIKIRGIPHRFVYTS